MAKPDTILGWYRKLIAHKFDGSKMRQSLGRPRIDEETENLVVRMAKENPSWGCDRIVGAMSNLGKTSFALIWMFWLEPISLPLKSSLSRD